MNLTNMYSVLVPQSWSQKQSVTSAKYLAKEYDPYSFYGGRKALNASGAFTDATDYVNKYVWKYGSTYYPQAPLWRSRLLSRLSTSRTTNALSWRLSKIMRPIPSLVSRRVISSSPTPSVSREIRASSRD